MDLHLLLTNLYIEVGGEKVRKLVEQKLEDVEDELNIPRLHTMPNDMIYEISKKLPNKDRVALASTCTAIHKMLHKDMKTVAFVEKLSSLPVYKFNKKLLCRIQHTSLDDILEKDMIRILKGQLEKNYRKVNLWYVTCILCLYHKSIPLYRFARNPLMVSVINQKMEEIEKATYTGSKKTIKEQYLLPQVQQIRIALQSNT